MQMMYQLNDLYDFVLMLLLLNYIFLLYDNNYWQHNNLNFDYIGRNHHNRIDIFVYDHMNHLQNIHNDGLADNNWMTQNVDVHLINVDVAGFDGQSGNKKKNVKSFRQKLN